MTDQTTLAHRVVFIDEWAALLCVTFQAGFVSAHESKAARPQLLLNVCWRALRPHPFVRFMAIAAAHLSLEHRMMMGQLERCPNVQVTLETSIRRFSWIDDRAGTAASLNVQTTGPMTRLAAHVFGVVAFCQEPGVRSGSEVTHDLFVARGAFFGADELRARDGGRRNNCSARGTAGK